MSVSLSTRLQSASGPEHCLDDGLRPRVSLIIACFNQGASLPSAIESVLNQTLQDFEIIIVDDGSTEDIAAVVSKYPWVKYLRQSNRGTAAARNAGWKASAAEYLVFLDADDKLHRTALEIGASQLDERTQVALTFGRCRLTRNNETKVVIQEEVAATDFYTGMLRGCMIWHPAAMMCRRTILESGVIFDETFKIGSDFDFYLRAGRLFETHCHNLVVSDYVQHESNKSHNLSGALLSNLSALRKQRPQLSGNPEHKKADKAGVGWAHMLVVHKLLSEFATARDPALERQRMFELLKTIIRAPRVLPHLLLAFCQKDKPELRRILLARLLRLLRPH